jgi:hypothetical protein
MEENNNVPATNGNEGTQPQNNQNNQTNSDKSNEAANNLQFGEEIRAMIPSAGTLKLTKEQEDALYAPVQDSDVYIKTDGLIYLSWIKYAGRLTKAFGGTGWTMLPQGMPKGHNNMIIWGFHLVINGIYCGFAIGEQQYFSNGRMTYGEACEGAKSNALMRLCKALGIGLELWDKMFIDRWLNAYADKVWNEQDRKYKWSLKPNAFGNTPANLNTPKSVSQSQTSSTANTKNANDATKKPAPPVKETPAKGKKGSKLPENNAFLTNKGDDIPLEQIPESEITGESSNETEAYKKLLAEISNSDTTGKLKMSYDKVKTALDKKEITEEEKETLRKLANQLFVKLASSAK